MATRDLRNGRPPLTDSELENLKPSDLLNIKLSSAEQSRLRDINAAREQERLQRVAALRAEEAPIVADLRAAGLSVNSVADLVSRREPYPSAIPILLAHVRKSYSDPLKSALARALAVPEPEVRRAWAILAQEYRSAATIEMQRAAQGLACALAVATTDETLAELIELIRDKRLGESRILLLSPLRGSSDSRALVALADAAQDPVLQKELSSWRHSSGPSKPSQRSTRR